MTDALDRVQKGDLYALLALCTKDELDPLVNPILDKWSNFLVIDECYKRFQPDHTKYHKVIGDEIRLYGGNSARNIMRGNEGPPYAEIVVDVCRKLDVPFEEGNTVRNEGNLLDIFLERRWRSLSSAEREKLTAAARESALNKISDAASIAKTGAAFILTRALFGPLGWATLGVSLLDAAFKVTIPCVLHLAGLRRIVLEERRGAQPQAWGASVLALAAPDASNMAERSNSLVVRDEDGASVLSMARMATPTGGSWHEIGESDDGISRLNPLLGLVPSLATAADVAGTNYMEVVTNGQRLMRTKAGVLKAITIDANGKISGIAEVVDSSKLSAMVNTSALLNVASVALAQKHLADISKKLSEIKMAVDDIRKFQRDELHALLTGSIRYFNQVAPSVLAGEFSDRVLNQVERHEADLLREQEYLTDEIRSQTNAITSLKDDEWFGSVELTRDVETHQRLLEDLYHELLLCIRARACGWQLLCIFPGEEMGKEHRRRDIQTSIDALEECGEMCAKTDEFLRKKISEISSFWNKESTVNERKLSLMRSGESLLEHVMVGRAEILRDLHAADAMLAAMKRPVIMAVRIEGQRIAAVRAL